MKNLSSAAKTALGGIMAALTVILLVPTAFETLVYAMPALASMLIMICVVELGVKWSLGVYAAASIICFIVIPNKEAVMMYAAFFGYYPIVKAATEKRLPRIAEYIVKFAVFNFSMVAATFLLVKLFGMPFDELMGISNDGSFFSKYAVPILLLMGNIVFIVLDFCLTRFITVYLQNWQKRFHKLFR